MKNKGEHTVRARGEPKNPAMPVLRRESYINKGYIIKQFWLIVFGSLAISIISFSFIAQAQPVITSNISRLTTGTRANGQPAIKRANESDNLARPGNPRNAQNAVRTVETPFIFTDGIQVGASSRNVVNQEDFGLTSRFKVISAPVLINDRGPVQIGDDAIIHGLIDVGIGLVNDNPQQPQQ